MHRRPTIKLHGPSDRICRTESGVRARLECGKLDAACSSRTQADERFAALAASKPAVCELAEIGVLWQGAHGPERPRIAGYMEIVAENLSCKRGGRPVLSDLSLRLGPGECLEVVGPNGAGKSTLIRALAGLGRIAKGTLRIPQERISYLGHRNGLKPQFSVDENLDFWARLAGTSDTARAKDVFGLTRLAGLLVRDLSEGQARRVALATAMFSGRPIWLLDEPLASLDKDGRILATRLIAENCGAGGISVVTAHQSMELPNSRLLELPALREDPRHDRANGTACAA